MRNPFQLDVLGPDAPFCDREQELSLLASRAESGINVVLFSPRRYGKTSLARRCQAGLARRGFLTPYVDFLAVTDAGDVAAKVATKVLEALHREQSLLDKGKRLLEGLRAIRPVFTPQPDGLGLGVELAGAGLGGMELLEQVMGEVGDLLARSGRRTSVVFDEFQEITRLPESGRVEAVLRSHIQHHGASYCFVGSRRGMLLSMFQEKNRAFHQSAMPLELPPLPLGEAADFVAGRFGSVGRHCPLETARTLVQAVEGYPYYVQRLALELFEQEAEGDGGAGVGRAMAAMLVGERYVFEGMVRSISRNQLKLLKALAAHPTDGVTSAAFLAESGLSGSSASQALDRLREEDLVERDSAGVWRLVDPIFARWLVDQRY